MSRSRGHIVERQRVIPRVVLLIFGLAGLVAVVTILALTIPAIVDYITGVEVSNDNRTWLTTSWTEVSRSDQEFSDLAEILKDNQIRAIYVQTNRWHGLTGEYIELPNADSFVPSFRKFNDTIAIYAWLIIEPDKLINPEDRAKLAEFAGYAVEELGYDGIHLQAKSVPDDDEDYVLLLRDLRAAIGPQIPLSVTVPYDRTPDDPSIPASPFVNPELDWSQEYRKRIMLNVNEIVLMAHASGIENGQDYEQWLAYQVASYARILHDLDIELTYVIALPTYDAERAFDPKIENPATAIQGILVGIEQAQGSGDQIDGVGLYPWDTTDLHELDTYWEKWVKR